MNIEKTIGLVCENGHLMYALKYPTRRPRNKDFCSRCGARALITCPNCENTPIELSTEDLINKDKEITQDLVPSFCNNCGEPYPWTSTIEEETARAGVFIDINDKEVIGEFYSSLIYEINLCYRVKADQAVLVLFRKLIENLSADILQYNFGMDQVELFYDAEKGQQHGLGKLLENLKSNKDDLQKFTSGFDEEFINMLGSFKYHGDASAHSIEKYIDEEELKSKSEKATHVTKVLLKLREKVRSTHRS